MHVLKPIFITFIVLILYANHFLALIIISNKKDNFNNIYKKIFKLVFITKNVQSPRIANV